MALKKRHLYFSKCKKASKISKPLLTRNKINAGQFVLEPYLDFVLLLLPNLSFGQGHTFKTELIIDP